ncbi:MAG: hypothetical protein IT577_23790 [Verrucomicrobiae bacterium]|nr:hypothetical protein [Verrucomicrobiae bacterium]
MNSEWVIKMLRRADPYEIEESVLLEEVREAYGRGGLGEFQSALKALESDGLIVCIERKRTRDRFWKLTPRGRGEG